MPGERRKGREFALQMLYQWELQHALDEEARVRFWAGTRASQKVQAFATALTEAVLANSESIDKLISDNLEQWKLSRLSVVVRSILRVSVCELLVLRDVPAPVIINEAVDLTRSFMDDDSARFVNSVLEKCWRAAEKEAQPEPTPSA